MGLMAVEDKAARKELRKELRGLGGILFHDGKTTYAWVPNIKNGNIGVLNTAICNPRDKFKRKYGEFLALQAAQFSGIYMTREAVKELYYYTSRDSVGTII